MPTRGANTGDQPARSELESRPLVEAEEVVVEKVVVEKAVVGGKLGTAILGARLSFGKEPLFDSVKGGVRGELMSLCEPEAKRR